MNVLVYMNDGKFCRVTPALGYTVESLDISRVVPEGIAHEVVDNDSMPNPILRDAWKLTGKKVEVDITKGKEVSHSLRQSKRADAFKSQGENSAYVAKDNAAQTAIDAATTETELLSALNELGIE